MMPVPDASTVATFGATTAQAIVATSVDTMKRHAREVKVRTEVMAWEMHPY
ncbi:unannotated protein [freshwater metagenome]|uniref:Unannotated protein n=1 Tax=freshwater metagenome TaxID=449393 RepID=A0A6J6GZY3_9ZZZZ